jgi:PTS system nitrogen regulatory IIA component
VQLTVREAAQHLGVDEATVRRWIAQRALPSHLAHEQSYINAVELWEWAVENGVPVSRRLLNQARGSPEGIPRLGDLLRAGGIFHDIPGTDKNAVLREFVERLPLPPDQDRAFLMNVLEAREAMGSTGIGDGIAIPHVRNPIVLHVEHPFVTLGLLRHAIDFGSMDGQPVHALFMLVSPTVPGHLAVLARLGFVLRDETLRELLQKRASAEEILDRIDLVEATRTTGSFKAAASP